MYVDPAETFPITCVLGATLNEPTVEPRDLTSLLYPSSNERL